MLGVVGFDFGSQYSLVAAARKGGIDVLANEASQRRTRTMVGYGSDRRTAGDAAAVQHMRNVANTVASIKQLLGRSWSDADLQAEVARSPVKVEKVGENGVGVRVRCCGEEQVLSPTQVAATYLKKLQSIALAELQCPVRDVVIGVPQFWTDAQRRAMMEASEIAGLNCLRLINETTATALSWGIFRPLAEKESLQVVFYDMGHRSLQVALVQFTHGKMSVRATAFDAHFGGESVDEALFDWAAARIQEKHKMDVRSNARASLRLLAACERLKMMLNSSPVAMLNVESLLNDVDVSLTVQREVLDELVQPLRERFLAPVRAVLQRAGVAMQDVAFIEAVGGASRLRHVQEFLQQEFSKEMSRTLNSEESVAKGCALMCAILSPALRVREYKVEESATLPVQLRWQDLNAEAASTATDSALLAFPLGAHVPSYKLVTFPKPKPMEVFAEYAADAEIPDGAPRCIARIIVNSLPQPQDSEGPVKMLLRVHMNESLLFGLESVRMEQRVSVPSSASSSSSNADPSSVNSASMDEEKDSASKSNSKSTATAPSEVEEESHAGATEEEKNPSKKSASNSSSTSANSSSPANNANANAAASKVLRQDIHPTYVGSAVSAATLEGWKADERAREAMDRDVEATEKAHNDLEAYILNARRLLDTGAWTPYAEASVQASLRSLADEYENWLCDFGDEAKRSEFEERLQKLQALGKPVAARAHEAALRPGAVDDFLRAMEASRALAASVDLAHEHIAAEEREKITAKIATAEAFVLPKLELQKSLPTHADPAVLTADLLQYAKNVYEFAQSTMAKPKPKPKPQPQAQTQTPSGKTEGGDAEAAPGEDAAASPSADSTNSGSTSASGSANAGGMEEEGK